MRRFDGCSRVGGIEIGHLCKSFCRRGIAHGKARTGLRRRPGAIDIGIALEKGFVLELQHLASRRGLKRVLQHVRTDEETPPFEAVRAMALRPARSVEGRL